MICPNCKQEIEDNSVFCEYCGTKIENPSDADASNKIETITPDVKSRSWWKCKWIIFAGIALLVVIVAIILLVNTDYVKANYFEDSEAKMRLADRALSQGDYGNAYMYYQFSAYGGNQRSAMLLGCAYMGWDSIYNTAGLSDYIKSLPGNERGCPYYYSAIEFFEIASALNHLAIGDRNSQVEVWLGDIFYGDYGFYDYEKGKHVNIINAISHYDYALDIDGNKLGEKVIDRVKKAEQKLYQL